MYLLAAGESPHSWAALYVHVCVRIVDVSLCNYTYSFCPVFCAVLAVPG